MIIAQVCLRLATIKGHSKMYSFTVLGGFTVLGRLATVLLYRCLPSALYSENRDSSVKGTPLQSARRRRM